MKSVAVGPAVVADKSGHAPKTNTGGHLSGIFSLTSSGGSRTKVRVTMDKTWTVKELQGWWASIIVYPRLLIAQV